MFSSTLTILLASASAFAASQAEFYLFAIRPGSDIHFSTINVRDEKLAVGVGYPADLHLDDDVLVSNDSGEALALVEKLFFGFSSENSPAHGFAIQNDYLYFGNNTLFACPQGNDFLLGVECDGGLPVMLRILRPYTALKKRDVEELEGTYFNGPADKQGKNMYFNDLTKPMRPPFDFNKSHFDIPMTFLTHYQGGFLPMEQPNYDVSSTKTTKGGNRRGPRYQRDYAERAVAATEKSYDEFVASTTKQPKQDVTIQTVYPSQIPNTEVYSHSFVSITPYLPHSMAGEIGKRHFLSWWLQFTELLHPKTTRKGCLTSSTTLSTTSSTSSTTLPTTSSSFSTSSAISFFNSSSTTTSR